MRKNRAVYGTIAIIIIGFLIIISYKYLKPPKGAVPQKDAGRVEAPGGAVAPSGAVTISIASSNTKQDWLHQAADSFNNASKTHKELQVNGKPIFVQILQEDIDGKKVDYRSGTMVSDTLNERIKPTIISPGEESWLAKFKKEWQVKHNNQAVSGDSPLVVRTPLVIAMWQSRAKALGCFPIVGTDCTWNRIRALAGNAEGWKLFGRPEWGKFTFGYGYFGESNSGTLGIASMCMVGANKTKGLSMADVNAGSPCGKFIATIEQAKVHSGKSDIWLLQQMITSGPEYLNAVITYESNVISMNKKHGNNLPEPLVAVYPQDGIVVVGHPFAILDGVPWVSADQVAAAKIFRTYLLSKEQQEAVLSLGLRPADPKIPLGPPIEQGFGANPQAKLSLLELPDTMVLDRIGEVWHSVKKKAFVVLVFDMSGSMAASGKIAAARKGAQEFIKYMSNGDYLIWMPFNGTVYADRTRGFKAGVGERLVEDIGAITATGDTALYDAISTAMGQLEELRKKHGDTVRYGIVVLSDGQDTSSKSSLTMVEARLKPKETDPSGIQIHTICIGSDCDEQVLKKISQAAHGKHWKGNTPEEMVKVYKEIATYY